MTQFLSMGGYWAFVWPAYALSAIAIGAMIVLTIRGYTRAKARLAAIERGAA